MGSNTEKLRRLSLIDLKSDDDLVKDIEKIINFFNKINSIETSGIEPLYHVLDIGGKLREDREIRKNTVEWIRKYCRTKNDHVIAPRTITEG